MRNKIESETIVDARKQSMGKADAIKLAKSVKEIYTCKGSKIVHIDLNKEKRSDD